MSETMNEVVNLPLEATNDSGLKPIEFKVLVKPDAKYKTVVVEGQQYEKSDGGILITQAITEQDRLAASVGTIIAVGDRAFEDFGKRHRHSDGRDRYDGHGIAVGMKVTYGRYAGQIMKGNDDEEYRMLLDKDIVGLVVS